MSLFALLKLLLMSVVVLVNGTIAMFIFYTEQKNDCRCGPEWRRNIIKFGALVITVLAILAYFTPIPSIIRMIPIIGGLFLLAIFGLCIVMIYCLQQYLKDVNKESCQCKEKSKLNKINNIIGPLGIATLAMVALAIIVILFYIL